MKLNPAVQIIIGEKLLSAEVFESYIKADDVEAQRILDVAPLTPEAAARRIRERAAREAKIGARDMAAAYAAQQPQNGPHSAMLGQAFGGGTAQMPNAPGKMFRRSDILAILRAKVAVLQDPLSEAGIVVRDLIRTFENLE